MNSLERRLLLPSGRWTPWMEGPPLSDLAALFDVASYLSTVTLAFNDGGKIQYRRQVEPR